MLRILSLILFLLFAHVAFGQDFSNKGNDFWIGYGNHVRMFNNGDPEQMQLYITSDVNTKGTVSIPSLGFTAPFQITANQITTVDIPRTAALLDEGQYNTGIHVVAEKPVVVYSFIYVNAISGATLCLPTNTLGREYYSINYKQESNETHSYSYFFVIAADTGVTTVQITPTQATRQGKVANVPFSVNLNQGQIYQVLADNDLTGSSIRSISNGSSCKRIAVFSGSGKISIGCDNSGTSDNLYQQMYPVSTWGKSYITVPSINLPNLTSQVNFYRVFKSDPNAQVKVNGAIVPANFFVRNQYADLPAVRDANFIESDKPILVAQYFSTQNCAGNGSGQGDPEMIYLTPLEQTINRVTLNSMEPNSNTNINQHYINVVLKNAPNIINSFTIDGQPAGNFRTHPFHPGYAYAQIPVSKGTHNLRADSGFNAIAYGFGNAESYGYSAGANLKDLYQFVSIRNQYAVVDFPAGCKSSPFKLSMTFPYEPVKIKWQFNGLFPDTLITNPVYDSTWVVNGKRLYKYSIDKFYTVPQIGTYPIMIIADNPTSDGCNGEQQIAYDLQIFERPSADFDLINTGCITDSVKVLDKTDGNGRPVIRWNWDFGGITSNLQNTGYRYNRSGTYTIRLSTITDVGCISDTIPKTVVLTDQPVAAFSISQPVCTGSPVTFTDLSIPAGSIKKWNWSFDNGDSSSATSPIHLFPASGVYNISLDIVSVTGCKSAVQTTALLVNPLPLVNFVLPEVCLNDPFALFTDSSRITDNSESQFRFSWNFGDPHADVLNPNSSASRNPQHKFMATGVYPVKLSVTSKDGCVVDTLKMFTVNGALPKADFDIVETLLCSNKDITFRDKSTVDFGNITRVEIYWDYGNDPTNKTIDEDPSPGKTYKHKYLEFGTPASKTYQVLYIAYSGASCISQENRTITLMASPKVDFTALQAVCREANSFQLMIPSDVFSSGGTGVFSGDGISSTGLFSPSATAPGVHTIRYTFTALNGCSTFAEQPIRVHPTPIVNAGPDRYVHESESIMINATASGGTTYQWLPETAIQDNTILSPTVAPVEDQVYRLEVKSTQGCTGSDAMKVTVLKKIKVPNTFSPNGDGINDTWKIDNLHSYPGATVEIFNRYGQQVYYSNGYSREWDGRFKGSPLPSATYYWIINPKDGRQQLSGSLTIIR